MVERLKIPKKTLKEIVNEITDRVNNILKNENINQSRTEKDKQIFEKLLCWFYENEKLAKEYFGDLYEKRHRLRTDEEIINDIKFKHDVLNNYNGYTEQEILELVNTPKNKLIVLTEDLDITEQELNEIIRRWQEQKEQKHKETSEDNYDHPIEYSYPYPSPENLIISLGINSWEELERAKPRFCNSWIGRYLSRISRQYDFEYVQNIIERSKRNIKRYLSQRPEYNCEQWHEESITVINGVLKQNRPIKLVVRPYDGGQVIIYYPNEFNTLESPDSELWIDDNHVQRILTLGQVLKYTGLNWIKIP